MIGKRFEEQAEKYPGKIAVKTCEETITYTVLNQQANQIARLILEKFDDRNQLSKTERIRYRRQIMLDGWGLRAQEQLKGTTVFAAGAGGSGSAMITQLALCGIGKIIVCDYDQVELSNLNRQFLHDESRLGMNKALSAQMTVNRINPNTEVIARPEKITRDNVDELVGDSSIIFDNVDDLETKFILSEYAVTRRIPHILSSMIDMNSYAVIFHTPFTPCFHCLYDRDKLQDILGFRSIAENYQKNSNPVVAPSLFLSTGFALNEALKIILGFEDPAYNKYFLFNHLNPKRIAGTDGYKIITYPFSRHFRKISLEQGINWEQGWEGETLTEIKLSRDPECLVCGSRNNGNQPVRPKRPLTRLAVPMEEKAEGVRRQTVALLFEHGVGMVAGILGVLKSGKIYVPLDPVIPEERLAWMLEDSEARVLVTNNRNLNLAESLCRMVNRNIQLINLQEINPVAPSGNLDLVIDQEQPAYILYTSGSTGHPKGVIQNHRNTLHFNRCYTDNLRLKSSDRLTLFSSYCFDAAVMDILGALLNGATLLPYDLKRDGSFQKLASWFKDEKVTVYHSTPTVFRYFTDTLAGDEDLSSVRLVVLGGEAVFKNDVAVYQKHFGDNCIFINGLGPTESTVTLQYILDKKTEITQNAVPVGYPVQETQVYLINEKGEEASVFEIGELVFESEFLALGYWNLPEKTAEAFVNNPLTGQGRVYKTGDLGRLLPDGAIEYIGRNDFQVKIRGYRVEPLEVENLLDQIEGIKKSAVVSFQNEHGENYLTAFFVSQESQFSEEQLRTILTDKLPEFMIPTYFIRLTELPLTPSGKIDRLSLAPPGTNNFQKKEYSAPTNTLEARLVEIWREILGIKKIGILDHFMDLGGHSLRATILISRIQKEFGVEISLRRILKSPTVKELAKLIEESGRKSYLIIPPAPQQKYYPLSSAQKRLYVLEQLESGSTAYNMPWAMVVEGDLNFDNFEKAFQALVCRHEPLRTLIEIVDGEPFQKVRQEVIFQVDYSETMAQSPDELVRKFIRPFDLTQAPLFRVSLVKTGTDRYLLLIDMHHIISDFISMEILVGEFLVLFSGKLLPELKVQYKDYAVWQETFFKSDALKEQEKYWLNLLAGEIPVLNLPTDFPRPAAQHFEGDRFDWKIDWKMKGSLKQLAAKEETTLFMFLLAVFNILLTKYSGREEIIVGSPIAGRPHPDLETMVGMFVNMLVFLNKPYGDLRFKDFLREVKENTIKAYENQDYQFEELVEKLNLDRNLARNPLFDVVLVLQNIPAHPAPVQGLKFLPSQVENRIAKFDLTLHVSEQDNSIHFEMEYCTKLYKKETIARLGRDYLKIMEAVIANPEIKISEIILVDPEERARIFSQFNLRKVNYPRNKTIHGLFEEQVELTPDRTAVVFGSRALSYRELNRKANLLAKALRNRGVHRDSIVGLLCERSLEMMIGLLGILKAGGAYLPLEPSFPKERIDFLLEDSGTRVVLVESGKAIDNGQWTIDNGQPIDVVNLHDEEIFRGEGLNPENINQPSDLAYVIYTSGTTGKPKGGMIEHRNVVRLFFNDQPLFDFHADDVWTMFHSFCFDFSVWEMYGALLHGGKLVIVPRDTARDPLEFLTLLKKEKVTILNQTPSAFYGLADAESQDPLKELQIRYLIFGGEALQPVKLKTWREKYPGTKLINMYGITETTVHVTYKEITAAEIDSNTSNIGTVIPTLSVYLMDRYLKPVPRGVPGEIYVGGEGVARGYLNRPELTESKFVKNPYDLEERLYKSGDLARLLPSGEMEYLGRIDHQVQIRGFRVELGEIESRLSLSGIVKETVVVAAEDSNGDLFLCAYFVPNGEPNVSDLRGYLARELPDYMIPAYFVRLEKMPLTSNGKVDRRALPKPDQIIPDHGGNGWPRNPTEEKLVLIWQEVLGIKGAGIDDDFFEIGGHSLKATLLVAKIHKEFNVQVPLREIFKTPTIRELAEIIMRSREDYYAPIQAADGEQEYYPATSAQKRLYILNRFEGVGTAYNIPLVLVVDGELLKEKCEEVFRKLIKRHETLRTSFYLVDGELVQKIHQEADFAIEELESEIDLSNSDEGIKVIINKFIRPFDLSKPPLFRVGLVHFKKGSSLFLFDMHHIISDGISMNILMNEFALLLNGDQLPQLRIQYKDYAVWLQASNCKRQEEYWLNIFKDEIPVLDMPTDYPRPSIQSFEGESIYFEIEKNLAFSLEKFIKNTGTTLYIFFLAAYTVLLSKYTAQDDIVVGSPIANRPHPDLNNLIGMFTNTLVMRNQPKMDLSFRDFLEKVKERALEAYENQEFQFEELVAQITVKRDLSRNPLFDTMLILQDDQSREISLKNLKVRPLKFEDKVAKFDLTLLVSKNTATIECCFVYCRKLFKKETVTRLGSHLINIFKEVNKNPEQNLSEIVILSEAEKRQLLWEFTNTQVKFPKEYTISTLFEFQAQKTPHKTAIIDGDRKLTYFELTERVKCLARILRAKGVLPGQIVGIMAERSLEMVIGVLAILRVGGAYLPLNPEYPRERIKFILDDSKTKVLLHNLADYQNLGDFKGEKPVEVIDIRDLKMDTDGGFSMENRDNPGDLAYVIYTSGSTGTPKGTMIEHFSVVNILFALQREYPIIESDAYLLKTAYTFDVSVVELFGWFLGNGSLVVLEKGAEKNPRKILETIGKYQVTHLNFVPSMFSAFIECLSQDDISVINKLKYVFVAGEPIPKDVARRFYNLTSTVQLENLYGPTEATIYATRYSLSNLEDTVYVPIGKPFSNIVIYIVSTGGQLQPIGVPGEIWISGAGVARGYLNLPELTQEKFGFNPFVSETSPPRIYKTGDLARWMPDGNIEFLGRIDNQVKIRGFRVELGEIEHHLLKLEPVKEATVIIKDINNQKYLCAYFVAKERLPLTLVREHLTATLPDYMIPSYFWQLDALPLTLSGKINRRELPGPEDIVKKAENFESPKDEREKILADVWEDVLGVKQIGRNDHFFNLGGDSIKAIQVMARLQRHQLKLELHDLFRNPKIKELATCLQPLSHKADQGIITGTVELTPIQRWFFERNFTNKHHFNQSVMLFKKEGFRTELVSRVFNRIVEHHDALRMVYPVRDGVVTQVNRGNEGELYGLEVMELSNTVDYAAAIEEEAVRIQGGINLETGPLLKLGLFKTTEGDHLLIIIHHLVVDGVSWRILLEDFGSGYALAEKGEEIEFQDKTDSFRDWALKIGKYADNIPLRKELSYWSGLGTTGCPSLPQESTVEIYRLKDNGYLEVDLEVEETAALLGKANHAYHTEINDLLLTALGLTVKEWSGKNQVLVSLEGHGREGEITGSDISRTIGWFTTIFPVVLEMDQNKDLPYLIKKTKENLRRIPHKGIGFGILKYLAKELPNESANFNLQPELSFNYLGQFDQDFRAAGFEISPFSTGPDLSLDSEIPYRISINGMVVGGRLKLTLVYNKYEYRSETIERLGEDLKKNLRDLINHCLSKEKADLTPSDYGELQLSVEELEFIKDYYKG